MCKHHRLNKQFFQEYNISWSCSWPCLGRSPRLVSGNQNHPPVTVGCGTLPLSLIYCHLLEPSPYVAFCSSCRNGLSAKEGDFFLSPPLPPMANYLPILFPNVSLIMHYCQLGEPSKTQISSTIVFLLLLKLFNSFPEFNSQLLVKYLLKPVEKGAPTIRPLPVFVFQ